MQSVADVDALGATADDPTPEEQAICSEELGLLRRALAALPARHRAALVLFKLEGWSYREIGKKLGVSHRTVERYVADAITRCHLVLRAKARQD